MPRYTDAIGYLRDLATSITEPWFTMICDLAISSGTSGLDDSVLDTLFALFRKQASYLSTKNHMVVSTPSSAAPPTPDFLEELSGFSNFKLLGCSLQMAFRKRLTVVFGANGSGKSSVCEALKVLANANPPVRPIQNVRDSEAMEPEFSYKFRSDAGVQSWEPSVGYGSRYSTLKYFDVGIALKNVKNALEPGRIIVLTPFKLHVFESAKALIMRFRETLQQAKQENATRLGLELARIRKEFEKFKGRKLSSIDERTLENLAAEIKTGEAFTQSDLLREKQGIMAELEKAASEEGLKLLKAEYRDLEKFLSSLGTILEAAEELWTIQPAAKAKDLDAKQSAQELLAKTLIPENGTLELLLSLLRAASELCNLESAAHQKCPLCRRELDVSEVELFKHYHDLLVGELEEQITTLRAALSRAKELAKAVGEVDRDDWDKSSTLSLEMLVEVKNGADLIIGCCDATKEPTDDARTALMSLKTFCVNNAKLLEQKAKAIETAKNGREELNRQLATLRSEIEPLEYIKTIADHLEALKEVQHMANESLFWDSKLPFFTQLLKKLTETAKEAHEELIVADFEVRLDAEYKALAEKPMTGFGVKLARKGSDALVTVLPQIGGTEIEGVLSEGEQRVHALALYFAELETCYQSVVVFDDPVSSFDYNYIANYCARLRDFALNHPSRQVIVLTHNWEFFVQLQTTFNAAGLNNDLSVQVMENCTVVADYSEKTDELKADITTILATPGESTRGQKEEMAGKMRRLIEAVVNTHVFANQRHQYKQKSQPVSDFQSFTKLVPLLSTEAATLRDLYAKLSITEHDDPRNAYVNTDKAIFQTRYDTIIGIEDALISRK